MTFLQKAFTLVEILLAACLLVVLAMAAVPHFGKSYQTLLLSRTAQDLAYLMRYARQRAIVRQKSIRLVFDSSFSRAQLEETPEAGAESSGADVYERIPGRWGRPFKIPEGVKLKTQDMVITFNPDGTTTTAECILCAALRCQHVVLNGRRGRVTTAEDREAGADDF